MFCAIFNFQTRSNRGIDKKYLNCLFAKKNTFCYEKQKKGVLQMVLLSRIRDSV